MDAVNCKIKLANKKFILVNIRAYNNFKWTKKGVIIGAEIWIIKTYSLLMNYSLLKSHQQPRFMLSVKINEPR